MKQYKQWSAAFRQKSLRLTNRAKTAGFIESPKACRRCGQTDGILHLHNEDYDVTVGVLTEVFDRKPVEISPEERAKLADALEPICWRCHMMHHSRHRNADAVDKYFEEVAQGKRWPAIFRNDFSILKRDHGV